MKPIILYAVLKAIYPHLTRLLILAIMTPFVLVHLIRWWEEGAHK